MNVSLFDSPSRRRTLGLVLVVGSSFVFAAAAFAHAGHDAEESSRTIEILGKLHPVLLHFPIAFLVLAGFGELVRAFRDNAGVARFVTIATGIGALGAIGAAVTGWIFAGQEHFKGDEQTLLLYHRWLGIATAVLGLLAWWAVVRLGGTASPTLRWLRRIVVISSGILVGVAAHYGAMIVWGADFFS